MSKVKYTPVSRRRRRRVSKQAKGFWGARHRWHRLAAEAVNRALAYGTRDRKVKKRDFRRLWILRISNACRELGLSYSKFMKGLHDLKIGLNRKILADLAVNDKAAFEKLVESVQKK